MAEADCRERHQRFRASQAGPDVAACGFDRWAKDTTPSPEATLILMESVHQIWKILESAPTKQRAVVFLRFSKDLKVAEIAERMSISQAAVKVHLFRAVQGIRKALRRARHI
jgi:RNA polymerase sigma factor (sigma-70 family)